MDNIITKMRNGERFTEKDSEFPKVMEEVENTRKLVGELNTGYHTMDEVRGLLEQIWGQSLDKSVRMYPPFNTNLGKLTHVGKGVFINMGCTFLDQGGITIDDDVFIAPGVQILTEEHSENPATRHNLLTRPVVIKINAWLGAGAIILPWITVGENSIVAAGAVVTKDVPDNSIVAGVPAKFIRNIQP